MKKESIIILIACVFPFMLNGQDLSEEVVASSGNCFEKPEACLAWTLGEAVTETYSNTSGTITQGFHQPDLVVTTSWESPESGKGITVYPVPFTGSLSVALEEFSEELHIDLFDVNGKKIFSEILKSDLSTFDFNHLSSGHYYLSVKTGQGERVFTATIVKH